MLYNFKDRALMGFKNNIYAKKKQHDTYGLQSAWKLETCSIEFWESLLITHSQILLTFQDGGQVEFPTLA